MVDARSIVVRCEILLLLQIKKVKLLRKDGKMLLSAGFKPQSKLGVVIIIFIFYFLYEIFSGV